MAINTNGYSTQRLSGLFSGMDTQSLVSNMLAMEQFKINKVFKQREQTQWKLEAYTATNTSVSTFRNDYFSVLGSKSVMKSSTYNAFKVNMTQNSAIQITGTASALANSFSIKKVEMATAASITSAANSSKVGYSGMGGAFLRASATSAELEDVDLFATIDDMADKLGLAEGEDFAFSINGETFSFSREDTLAQALDKVNASEASNVSLTFENNRFSLKSMKLGDPALSMANITGNAFGGEGLFGMGEGDVKYASAVDENTTFADLAALGVKFGDAFAQGGISSFTIAGQSFTFQAGDTVFGLMDEVNGTDVLGVKMSYSAATGRFRMESAGGGNINASGELFSEGLFNLGDKTLEYASNTPKDSVKRTDTLAEALQKMGKEADANMSVNINGQDFTFDTSKTTISAMMSAISNSKDAQATFTFSEMTDSFRLTSSATGAQAALSVSGLEIFGLTSDNLQAGQDAKLTLDDGTEIVRSNNAFQLDGMNFEILKNYDASASGENIDVTVTRDYSHTIDAIKGFIDEYNKLIDDLNGRYTEPLNAKYQPLTEDERANLTEKEAEKWDEKAKSGMLKNDSSLGSMLASLRSALGAKVESTGLSAYDLGITTMSWSSTNWKQNQGKLVLDEDRLMKALQENPNAVQDTLAKTVLNENGVTDTDVQLQDGRPTAQSGLFARMSQIMNNFNTKMRDNNIKNATKSVESYTTRMADMTARLAVKEERYWAKFTEMEKMMSQMQSQMNWLQAQLGLSSNNK